MYPLVLAISALLGLSFYVIYPQIHVNSCLSLSPQYRLYAGQTTPDEASNGSLGGIGWTSPGPGYVPYKFLMLSKHGARHLKEDHQWRIASKLKALRDKVRPDDGSVPGSLCPEDWEYIESWSPLVEPSNSLRLAYEGWQASRDLGDRYRQRYPYIFGSVSTDERFEFLHNDMAHSGNATVDTAKAFVTGIFGSHVGVNITQPRYPDTLLEYYKYCQKYIVTVPTIPDEYSAFVEGPWMQSVLRTMEIRLGLNPGNVTLDDAISMYDSCRTEYSIRVGNSPWCVMFREEDAEVMEYALDLYDYYRNGYGYDINYEQSCNLFAELVHRILGPTVTPYKVHAWWMLPEAFDSIIARLGLWAGDAPLKAEDFPYQRYREWRSSRHAAMGSNLVFVVHNDTYNPYQTRVQVFHNEHLIKLPICYSSFCTESEIRDGWEMDATNCNFVESCTVSLGEE